MRARTRKDWILWGALGCALVSTAHAEYTLATAAHFNEYVALAVPGALDLYVVRALQQRRDVFVAVLAMVAANVASHLIAGGVLEVRWPVIAAVGAVAPLIVWRVYSLKYESGAVSAPAPEDGECAPAEVLVAGQGLEYGPRMMWGALPESEVPSAPAPDRIPEWMADEYPPSAPHSEVPYVKGAPMGAETPWAPVPGAEDLEWKLSSAVPYLAPVPDLPPEYQASAVHSETECALVASDWDYLEDAQAYVKENQPATVKGLRRELKIGQERAERLLAHLGVRP